MKAFKGFNNKLQCTPDGKVFQYETGKTYEEPTADICSCGFHACEDALDVFNYYPPAGSRYCEVDLDANEQTHNDSKRVGKKITIVAELGFRSLIEAAIKFRFDRCTFADGDKATGDQGAASATGDQGAASATGSRGAASATGYQGAASATGYQGAASATGYQGAASVSGMDSVAITTGYNGKANGALGCWIVVTERGDWNGRTYPIKTIKTALVDGETIKADTWYKVVDGEFVEVSDDA